MVFDKIRKAFSGERKENIESMEDEYVEIDVDKAEKEKKVLVKLFVLKKYDDVDEVLNALREGYTIAVIDIRSLKKKDPVELKRAVSKIKKTVGALEGSIAGFTENTVIATPSFAQISKETSQKDEQKQKKSFDTY
ncbi:MAG TPA: cell division protein SepF [Candidatus Nanoarchaeia archaeon]|nr:cell division protein SepF [Candidatus Nanoarchaeia archaeon]